MKGNPAKLLADTPSVDGSKSENRSLPERLPVRRIGLEQEFFLVDRSGVLRDLAEPYLRRCREARRDTPAPGAARGHGLARREGGTPRPDGRPKGASRPLQPRHRP